MANEFPGISKDAYMNSDSRTGRALTYDMLSEIREMQREIKDENNQRLCKLERKKIFDTTVSTVTGIIGGILAFLLSPFFSK